MPYPPESDNARRIRFVSEVNAMASIKSRHTVPLLGIMFGVQGQEDSLGICIGNSSLASVHDDVMWSRSSRVVGGSGRLPRDNEALRLGGGDGKPLARISLVMPFYSLGSLGERLKHPSLPRLSWLHKLLLCWDIVTGVMDSHNADVIHKDLKCDNIVLERDALDLGEATLLRGVVCDFGLANVANQARSVLAALFGVRRLIFTARTHADTANNPQGDTSVCGTRGFIAPEIWENSKDPQQPGDVPYKAASDVYSLGMTFYEILTEKRPPGDLMSER
jgi:serine/threonine protein kinase